MVAVHSYGIVKDHDPCDLGIIALSFALARRHFGRCILITNPQGADFLSRVPYDDVIVGYHEIPRSNLFVYNKLVSHTLMREPFVNIDTDCFLFEGLSRRILSAGLFCHFLEKEDHLRQHYHFDKFLGQIRADKYGFIEAIKTRRCYACNTGIFGGNNLRVIHDYAHSAIDLLFDENNSLADEIGRDCNASMILEQYFLPVVCEHFDAHVAVIDEHYAGNNGRIHHYMADHKRQQRVILFARSELRRLFPQVHRAIGV